MPENDTYASLCLLDLPWEHVLFKHILPHIELDSLFRLREVNSQVKLLVETYFQSCFHMDTSNVNHKITVNAFRILTRNSNLIKSLVIRKSPTHLARSFLLTHDGKFDWLYDRTLLPVIERNMQLLKLDLSSCCSLTNAVIRLLTDRNNQLQQLSVAHCLWFNVESCDLISRHCSSMTHLDLTRCWKITDDAIVNIIEGCPRLVCLCLAELELLTDHSICIIARKCKCLHDLDLRGCWRLTHDGIRLLAEYCHTLRSLKIKGCPRITNNSRFLLQSKNIQLDINPMNVFFATDTLYVQI